jgi:hypothetical protein
MQAFHMHIFFDAPFFVAECRIFAERCFVVERMTVADR